MFKAIKDFVVAFRSQPAEYKAVNLKLAAVKQERAATELRLATLRAANAAEKKKFEIETIETLSNLEAKVQSNRGHTKMHLKIIEAELNCIRAKVQAAGPGIDSLVLKSMDKVVAAAAATQKTGGAKVLPQDTSNT
uniref:Uncharacterized protein n=1 Tax=Mantoniella antarctica TaxID=81844 RepID=A0A7S0X4M2_9CHLO|mmetsp:Transcript_16767/g.41295  ORF Transcript_16767/g.41295 Transcript_16767/m.41295 type:complete len:136 (+) Transcript_16767:206-613(+)|eukprot:CAMPEP_0181369884 /NCGR_PEP_ID=MMETSP1106-20121128/13064_1 /TAXON_ID=81844 /ORGANISM="Mantoniella antarctica, Strain SL-175" /LENGTH=135 /DNA_ID=CAMNT_0023486507 /DNA_START=185 /DNA_END=592 /DNA_ORIENTATION=-